MTAKCKPADVGIHGQYKISRCIEVRTLEPLADVIAQKSDYFSRVRDMFQAGERVSFTRFASDAYDAVCEILPLALANREGSHIRFYPRSEIVKTDIHPETGWKLAQHEGHWVARCDGRTVGRFPTRPHAEKFLAEKQV